jgi:hypothetical protein
VRRIHSKDKNRVLAERKHDLLACLFKIKKIINDNNIDPSRIYNADETPFLFDYKHKKVKSFFFFLF